MSEVLDAIEVKKAGGALELSPEPVSAPPARPGPPVSTRSNAALAGIVAG